MKSILISSYTMLILLATSSFAQNYPPPEDEAEIGRSTTLSPQEPPSESRFLRRIILGGSLMNAGYEGTDVSRYSKPNGFSAGFLLDIIGTKKLVFETGAQYRQLGATYDAVTSGGNTLTAEYITIPVTAKYYFNGQDFTSFYIKGGVQGSTLLTTNKVYISPSQQIGARLWETALLAGLGVKLNLSPYSDIVVEANYNRSIDPVFENSNVYRSDLSAAAAVALTL